MNLTFVFAILAVILLAPLMALSQRLPRRRLGMVRIVSGIGMIVLATVSLPRSRSLPLQLFGAAMILWGLWMVRPVANSQAR